MQILYFEPIVMRSFQRFSDRTLLVIILLVFVIFIEQMSYTSIVMCRSESYLVF